MTKPVYKLFFLWPSPWLSKSAHNHLFFRSSQILLSLLDASSHYIIKVINPVHDMPDTSKHWFVIYHLYYKHKQVSNLNRISICIAYYFYFGYNLNNLSIASLFAYDDRAYATELGLVTKKRKPPRTALNFSNLQSLSLLFSLTIFKCALISRWQLSSTLASFLILADNQSVKLTSKDLLFLSHTTKTVQSFPDNVTRVYKQLQWQINNSNFYTIANSFDIKKQHSKKYQIEQTKSYHYHYYGLDRTGEYK